MQLSISLIIKESLLIGLIALLSGCKKDVLSPVDQTADRIEGTFALTQISWEGTPVDLNGDGIANNNLYEELLSLPTNAQNQFQTDIRSYTQDRREGVICIQFPIQNLSSTHDGRYPTGFMIGNTLSVDIRYQIDADGRLSVDRFVSFDLPEDDLRIEIRSIQDGIVSFNEKSDPRFTAKHTFYDRKSGQLINGTLTYHYSRVKL
ncbi:MAG: hypothetical protein K6E35_06160 [Bacteroidales bacterium]|nr:hypothetical protein [Bacteroidales bacterium]